MPSAVPGGALDGRRDDLVVYFSGSWWDGPPGHDRHMAEALSRLAPVLFVEPPISSLTRLPPHLAETARRPWLRVLGPRLAHLSPRVLPGITRPGLHRLVAPLMRRAVRAALTRLYGRGEGPVAAVVASRVEDLWSAVTARRRLFYATDDLVAGAELLGIPRARLIRDEARALRDADVIAVVSGALRDRYARAGYHATLVPNGCDPDAFGDVDRAPLPDDARLTRPVAGMLGQLNDRIDLGLLEAVADTGHSLLLVGPRIPSPQEERFRALVARPNVRWVGAKPAAQVPGYLRVIDVGLTPYVDSPFNRASFPLKTLEYLAAGRGVVATPLPAHESLATDLITVAAGPERFAAAVRAAFTESRTEALIAHRRAFARQHAWGGRAALLATMLDIPVVSPAAPAPPLSTPSVLDG